LNSLAEDLAPAEAGLHRGARSVCRHNPKTGKFTIVDVEAVAMGIRPEPADHVRPSRNGAEPGPDRCWAKTAILLRNMLLIYVEDKGRNYPVNISGRGIRIGVLKLALMHFDNCFSILNTGDY
jgi:hypothetical protein